jgi:FtsP/CotA-like multicopper oxidase with cupredoxin domain
MHRNGRTGKMMNGRTGTRRAVIAGLLLLAGGAAASVAFAPHGPRAGPAATGVLREFTLVAGPVPWEIQTGLVVDGWGYNGQTPGPLLRVTEGDHVRITLINHLPVPTTIHWHGIDVPIAQDGVPGLSQQSVEPAASFVYDFTATNPGTRWYHSHVDSTMQIQLGLFGAFIVEPKTPEPVTYAREFTYLLSEKALDVTPRVALGEADIRNRDAGNGRGGAFTPDLFLFNGRSATAIAPLTIGAGERIRIRLINAGNQAHAIHLHGHSFKIIATDGNPVPATAQLTKDTVLIGSSERYDLEVVGSNPGIWMFHCHINNHAANGMVTELRYDGAEPLAGGDHGPAHAPASTAHSRPSPIAPPAASQTPAPAATNGEHGTQVTMVDDRFVPSRLTVPAGTTVTWVNTGNNFHDPGALNGDWRAGLIPRDGTFSWTFPTPGVYQYLCLQHFRQGMRGTITVEPP